MRVLKRVLDFVFALITFVIISPFFVILMILVKITSKGPIFYKHLRVGKFNKYFYVYKFRTMKVINEPLSMIFTPEQMEEYEVYFKVKNDPRITRFGRFLRKSSLDELPQLFNILKGDMSFIGPRPPLTYHPWSIEQYTKEQLKMFNVRPGITGWAQVNGRKAVEWNKRIELNTWYVDNVSLCLDIKICFMTAFKVFTNADNENVGETVKKETVNK